MEGNKSNKISFSTVIDDIRHAKNQQWLMSYYSLLILSGIVGLYNLMSHKKLPVPALFVLLCKYSIIIIPILANWFLLKYQSKIIRYRYIKNKSLNKTDKEIFEIKENASWSNVFVDLYINNFCLFFILVYFIADFFVSIYIFYKIDFWFTFILLSFSIITNIIFICWFKKKFNKYQKSNRT